MLAGERQLLALVGDLAEEARILDRQHRLAGEGLHQPHRLGREFARLLPHQDDCPEDALGAGQRHDQCRMETGGEGNVAERVARPLREIGELNRHAARDGLAHRALGLGNMQVAHRAGERLVPPHRLHQPEGTLAPAVAENRPGIRPGHPERGVQNSRQHGPQIERRADRLRDLIQHLQLGDRAPELGGTGAQFVEQPRILDCDHRLVGKGT